MVTDVKAIAFGMLLSAAISSTMVIAGLKAGICPGISPLVILCAWGGFSRSLHKEGSMRFLNLVQAAGSAGMAVTGGIIFPAPLLQHLYLSNFQDVLAEKGVTVNLRAMAKDDRHALLEENGLELPSVDVSTIMFLCFIGVFIGWGFIGLGTRFFLADPNLPAPEARACETLTRTATTPNAKRPKLGVSLVLSVAASILGPMLSHLGITSDVILFAKDAAPHSVMIALPFNPLNLGIGGILPMSTSLVLFAGAFLHSVGDLCLASMEPSSSWSANFPSDSMRWVGGGAMTVALLYSLLQFMLPAKVPPHGGSSSATPKADILSVPRSTKVVLVTSIGFGLVALAVWIFSTDGLQLFDFTILATIVVMAGIMVPLGAQLSLQVGTSSSPISGTIFVSLLLLALVAMVSGRRSQTDVALLMFLGVSTCVAVFTANDSSQDYRTLQLCDVAPREGFLAQLMGLIAGCVCAPVALYVADNAYGLGSNELPAPQGQMFATLIQGLLIEGHIPWWPVMIGMLMGSLGVLVQVLASRHDVQLPAMALALGLYLPPSLEIGILIGAVFRRLGEQAFYRKSGYHACTHESILAAAGLLTGSATLDLVLGVASLFGFKMTALTKFSSTGGEGTLYIPGFLQGLLGLLGICLTGLILTYNSWVGTVDQTASKLGDGSCGDDSESTATERSVSV